MSDSKTLILAVDDDADLLATLADFLQFEGYEVESVSSAEAGIAKLATIVPDLIILDISMPGMGGIGFLNAKAQMERVARVPVMVFTARANMETFFKEINVAGFATKPCDPAELLKELRRILADNPSRGTAGKAKLSGAAKKLLIAEDEPGQRETLLRYFSGAGFDTAWASTGPEVVEKAIVEKPDAILMRLVMEKLNGDATASMLSDIPSTRSIPVVLYDDTGSQPRESIFNEEGSGKKRLVRSSKPEDLVQAVQIVLGA